MTPLPVPKPFSRPSILAPGTHPRIPGSQTPLPPKCCSAEQHRGGRHSARPGRRPASTYSGPRQRRRTHRPRHHRSGLPVALERSRIRPPPWRLAQSPELARSNATRHSFRLTRKGSRRQVACMRHATELDPLSFFMARHYGSTLFYARRYQEALTQLLYARSMRPGAAPVVDVWISAVYQQQGNQNEAVALRPASAPRVRRYRNGPTTRHLSPFRLVCLLVGPQQALGWWMTPIRAHAISVAVFFCVQAKPTKLGVI